MREIRKRIAIWLLVLFIMLDIDSIGTNVVYAADSSTKDEVIYVKNESQLAEAVHDEMLQWKTSFTVRCKGSWSKVFSGNLQGLFKDALAIDDKSTSDDFDYMRGTIKTYGVKITENSKGSEFMFSVTYRETWKQHKKVNQFVKSTLDKLNLDKKSDYAKIKAIHNYIINRVSYDQSCTNFSAYSAAIKKKAVCQGYALLFYKMAAEAGIQVRCVESVNHEWNIVKLGKKWYHVDTTWDDPVASKPMLVYDYFLKGSKTMAKTHTMMAEYNARAFKSKYPISTTDYK